MTQTGGSNIRGPRDTAVYTGTEFSGGEWRWALAELCTFCGAAPGHECTNPTGDPVDPHSARVRLAGYKRVPS